MVETKQNSRQGLASDVQRTISRILHCYRLFGFDPEGYNYGPSITYWLRMCESVGGDRDSFIKVAKYKLNAFYSGFMNQESPIPPPGLENDNPYVLLGGRAMRWVGTLVRKGQPADEQARSFLFSIKMVKKGLPRPSAEFLRKAEADAFQALTAQRREPKRVNLVKWADVDEKKAGDIDLDRGVVVRELRRTVSELFQKATYTDYDRYRPFFPSTSANYIRSRSGGGAVEAVLSHPELLAGLRSKDFFPVLELKDEDERKARQSDRFPEIPLRDTPLVQRWRIFYDRLLAVAESELPLATPVALAEALKARVISKGPPFLYTVMKPLQEKMWSTLRAHPAFRLIGQPLDKWYLQERLGSQLGPDEGYLSGDYADATNRLQPWVSEEIGDAIATELDLSLLEQRLLIRSLTGHIFDYAGERKEQLHGQLMGSVTSFPILCIANAAMTRYALEQAAGRRLSMRAARCAFNGDDIVARGSEKFRQIWRKVTGYVGLEESVGKTYFSRTFLEMNSRMFSVRSVEERVLGPKGYQLRRSSFQPVGFVNFGLIYGMKRASSDTLTPKDAFTDTYNLGASCRDLVDSAPGFLKSRVVHEFIVHNLKTMTDARVPWYVDSSLGGLGLPTWIDHRNGETHGPSLLDAQKALRIRTSGKRGLVGSNSHWLVWRLANARLRRQFPSLVPQAVEEDDPFLRERVEGSDHLVASQVLGLLFDSDVDFSHLYRRLGQTRSAGYALQHNRRLWTLPPVPIRRKLNWVRALAPLPSRSECFPVRFVD